MSYVYAFGGDLCALGAAPAAEPPSSETRP
jgi:hypothetical protein